MASMADFAVLFWSRCLFSLHVLFTPQYTPSGASADLFTKSTTGVIWQPDKFDSLLN